VLLVIFAGTCMAGLLLRRWWLLWVVVALAIVHALWILAFGSESSAVLGSDGGEDSTAQLLVLSAAFFYVPALIGAFSGIMLGLLVRDPRR